MQVSSYPVQLINEKEPPMPELIGWTLHSDNRIFAQFVKNHPTLGDAPNVVTSRVTYINREMRIAITKNTAYKLTDEQT